MSSKKFKYQFGGGVDLIKLAAIESSFKTDAVSATNDYGLLQINPSALKEFNSIHKASLTTKDLLDPNVNVKVGDWYINRRIPELLKSEGIEDTVENRLAAYNQGARGVARDGISQTGKQRYQQYMNAKYAPHSNFLYLPRDGKQEQLGIHPALGPNPMMMGPNILPNFQLGGQPTRQDSVDLYNYYLLQKEIEGYTGGEGVNKSGGFNTIFNPFKRSRERSLDSINKGPRDDFFPSETMSADEVLRRNNILRDYADKLILNNPNLAYEQDINSPDIYARGMKPVGSYISELAGNYVWPKPDNYDETQQRERIQKIKNKANAGEEERLRKRQEETDWAISVDKARRERKNHNLSTPASIDSRQPSIEHNRQFELNPQFTNTILPRPGVSGFNTRNQIMYDYNPNTQEWGRAVGIKGYKRQYGGYTLSDVLKRAPRKGVKNNDDGSVSTHLMSYGEADGNYYGFPTLFQDSTGQWYSGGFEEAKKLNQLFKFKTEKEAAEFAGGAWKNKQHGGLVNLTGYTPGTESFNNPINIIPSNNITMENTPFNVLGIPDRGNSKLMKPGTNHTFPGANYVKEIPLRQYGGPLDFLSYLSSSIAGGAQGTNPLTPFGSNAQANSVLQGGVNVGKGFLETNADAYNQKIDNLQDKYQGSTIYPGYQNENMPFGEFHYFGGAHGTGAANYADAQITAQQEFNSINKSLFDNMKGAGAANAFGVLFGLGQQNQKNAERRVQDPLYRTNMQNYTTGPTIVKHGGKMHYQSGGEVQPPIPVQTEKGETVLLPNGDLVNVNANKMHKQMDGQDVTDILPAGSFVYSNDKNMKISKDKADAIELGYEGIHYDENEIGTPPDLITLGDFFPKGKKNMTFAELSKQIRNKYKVSTRDDDAFANRTKEMNKNNRQPLLELLKAFNIEKMPKSVKEKQGIDSLQYGGNVFSSKFRQENNNAITGMDTIDLMENRDKALRNDGLFPTNLFSQNPMKGLKAGNSFMKGQYGLAIGSAVLGGINQIFGSRAANNNYRQRISEIEDLQAELNDRINMSTGIQALGTLGQDTSYTTLNTDPVRAELLSGFRGAEQAINTGRDITNNQINAGNRTLLRGLTDAGFGPGEVAANYAVNRAQGNEAISRNNAGTAQQIANLRLQRSAGLQNLNMTDQTQLQNAANYTRGAQNQVLRNLSDIGTQNQTSLMNLAQMEDAYRAQARQDKATAQANVLNNTFQLLGGAASIASNTFQANRLMGLDALGARAAAPTTVGHVPAITPPLSVQSTALPRMAPIITSPFAYPIG